MSGLRVCMVTTFYPPHNFGGDGVAVERLAHALARRGHDVTVVVDTDAFRALGGGDPEPAPSPPNVTVHRLRSRVPRASTLLTQQLGRPVVHAAELRRLVTDGEFDVVHFHNVSLVGGPGALALGTGIKLYSAHEHWLVCPTHVLWRHDREPCPAKECLRCQLRQHRPPQLWRYSRLLEEEAAHVDAFIAMSHFSRAKHHEFGFAREMEVIPPFLPAPDRLRTASARPHERPYVVFAGRLERMKGLDDVLPVFRDHDDGVDLVVAGDGTHADALREIAAGSPRVRFLGRVDPAALDALYEHALAAVVSTVGFETFGMVTIEAFSQRTPVLARRTGPLPEVVEGCGGGIMFATPDELRAAVQTLVANPARREALSRAAYAGYVARWTEEAVMPQYLALIERLASEKRLPHVLSALSAAGHAA